MVSSTEGSLTKIGWKRRASAASFSTCFWYSSSVVAPMQCNSARKRGFEQVRRVHRAVGLAGPDQRVHLVDEQDDAAFGRGDFLQHGFQPLLELAAVFRA